MNPVEFKERNCVYGGHQPEYKSLPAYRDNAGMVTSCWRMSFIERIKVLVFGKIWLRIATFGNPLQPTRLSAISPFTKQRIM